MCLLLREAMTVGRICLHKNFFSTEMEVPEARKRIKDELLSFCVVTEAPKTTFGKGRLGPHSPTRMSRTDPPVPGLAVRKTYTGKLYGKQDDLAIAIQLAVIGCSKFFQVKKLQHTTSILCTHLRSFASCTGSQVPRLPPRRLPVRCLLEPPCPAHLT